VKILTVEQHINEISFQLGKTLFKYTPIIINRSTKEKVVSSSLLLKAGTNSFLVMAGHTIKSNKAAQLGLTFGNAFISLGDQSYVVSNPEQIDDDKVDCAIFKLTDGFVNVLPPDEFQFVDLNRINIDHDDIEGYNYVLFGYPISKSSVRAAARKIRIEPFNFRTSLIQEQNLFKKIGVSPLTHQLLYYRKRSINDGLNNRVTGPDPVGLSGAGIWCIPTFVTDKVHYFPTGIATEFNKQRSCILGTRIRVITEMIHREFGVPMPRSRKVNLGFTKRIDLSNKDSSTLAL